MGMRDIPQYFLVNQGVGGGGGLHSHPTDVSKDLTINKTSDDIYEKSLQYWDIDFILN